jgi:MFS family permease
MYTLERGRISLADTLLGVVSGLLYVIVRSDLSVIQLSTVALLLIGALLALLAASVVLARYHYRLALAPAMLCLQGALLCGALLAVGTSLWLILISLFVGSALAIGGGRVFAALNRGDSWQFVGPIVLVLALSALPPMVQPQTLSPYRLASFLFLAGSMIGSFYLIQHSSDLAVKISVFFTTLAAVGLIALAFAPGGWQWRVWLTVVIMAGWPVAAALVLRQALMPLVARIWQGAYETPAEPAAWAHAVRRLLDAGRKQWQARERPAELPPTAPSLIRWSTARHQKVDMLLHDIGLQAISSSPARSVSSDPPDDVPNHLRLYVALELSAAPFAAAVPAAQRHATVAAVIRSLARQVLADTTLGEAEWQRVMAQLAGIRYDANGAQPGRSVPAFASVQVAEAYLLVLRALREEGRWFELIDLAHTYLGQVPDTPRRAQVEAELAYGEYHYATSRGRLPAVTPHTSQRQRRYPGRPEVRIVNMTATPGRRSGIACRVIIDSGTMASFDLAGGEGVVLPLEQPSCEIVLCPYDGTYAPLQMEWRGDLAQTTHQSVALVAAVG